MAKNVRLSLHNSFCLKGGIYSEESIEPGEEITRAKGMDASLRTAEGNGRNRDEFR